MIKESSIRKQLNPIIGILAAAFVETYPKFLIIRVKDIGLMSGRVHPGVHDLGGGGLAGGDIFSRIAVGNAVFAEHGKALASVRSGVGVQLRQLFRPDLGAGDNGVVPCQGAFSRLLPLLIYQFKDLPGIVAGVCAGGLAAGAGGVVCITCGAAAGGIACGGVLVVILPVFQVLFVGDDAVAVYLIVDAVAVKGLCLQIAAVIKIIGAAVKIVETGQHDAVFVKIIPFAAYLSPIRHRFAVDIVFPGIIFLVPAVCRRLALVLGLLLWLGGRREGLGLHGVVDNPCAVGVNFVIIRRFCIAQQVAVAIEIITFRYAVFVSVQPLPGAGGPGSVFILPPPAGCVVLPTGCVGGCGHRDRRCCCGYDKPDHFFHR